jgi:hypothetical protein
MIICVLHFPSHETVVCFSVGRCPCFFRRVRATIDRRSLPSMLIRLPILSFTAILQVPTTPAKCWKPFDVKFTSATDIPFSLCLADPSTRARWYTWPPRPSNTVTHLHIPCHLLSDSFWLLIVEKGEIHSEAPIRFSDPFPDPLILSPNSVVPAFKKDGI